MFSCFVGIYFLLELNETKRSRQSVEHAYTIVEGCLLLLQEPAKQHGLVQRRVQGEDGGGGAVQAAAAAVGRADFSLPHPLRRRHQGIDV